MLQFQRNSAPQHSQFDVVLLDMSSLFFRSYCAITYESEEGVDMSGVVGTMQTIESILKRHNPTVCVAVFDGKGGSKKKRKIFESYKEGRKIPIKTSRMLRPEEFAKEQEKSRENFLYQLRRLNELLSVLPIHRVTIEGYEADELIAYLSQNYFDEMTRLIVSGDKDFQQLVNDKCSTYYLHDKKIHGLPEIKQTWGSDKGRVVTLMRCFDGDGSDNIPGVHGYGLKTLHKYFPTLAESSVQNLDDFKAYISELKAKVNEEKTAYAKNWKTVVDKCNHILVGKDKKTNDLVWDILERNWRLMQLFEPEINTEAKLRIQNAITDKLTFLPIQIRRFTITEGIKLRGHDYDSWQAPYKGLEYNQAQASEKMKNLIEG